MNQKLINDLREGRIVLKNEPKNPEAVSEILKEAFPSCRKPATGCACFYYRDTTGLKKWVSRGEKCYSLPDLPQIPIADFLRPEPRFKVGDTVITKKYKHDTPPFYNAGNMDKYVGVQGEITSIATYEDGTKAYVVHNYYWPESALELANGTIYESSTICGTEQLLEVGQQYEFSVCNDWIKGTLLGIVDNQYKYIALVGTNKVPLAFDFIRPIQPVKVYRWINVCPDGRVLRKSYETKQEARDKACQGGMTDCKQVRLEGVIL